MNRTATQSHLTSVPTLNELLLHPEQVKELPVQVAADLLAQVASLQPLLLSRLFVGMPHNSGRDDAADRLLLVTEAASLLGMTNDYLYRHADKFPFTVRPAPRQIRFSQLGIQRYIAQRQGR